MLLDQRQRRLVFSNENGSMIDMEVEFSNRQVLNMWTSGEKETFREKYVQQPKNFSFIAASLERKSAQECVRHYYLSKKQENYKQLLRKSKQRTRSARNPQKSNQNQSQFIVDLMTTGVTTRLQRVQQQKSGGSSSSSSIISTRSNTASTTSTTTASIDCTQTTTNTTSTSNQNNTSNSNVTSTTSTAVLPTVAVNVNSNHGNATNPDVTMKEQAKDPLCIKSMSSASSNSSPAPALSTAITTTTTTAKRTNNTSNSTAPSASIETSFVPTSIKVESDVSLKMETQDNNGSTYIPPNGIMNEVLVKKEEPMDLDDCKIKFTEAFMNL